MADANHKPVIFLAFANDRDDSVRYLRNLPDEARRLRKVLEPAAEAGLCEVVVRSNSTARDIFEVFQDAKYRKRVAIFHYGGHANGCQLLLESEEGQAAAAYAGGLAAFLAQQRGLQLVFLNGCSTQQQTRDLLDANIPAVISTSRSIDDQVATDFAHRFYGGLAGGATVRTAFNEAEAAVQTAKGGHARDLYCSDPSELQSLADEDRWPWSLHVRSGSENAEAWNLPEAVNDPLFGLPPPPEQDLPESPYRHLNWFTRKDAEVFFGRGHEIRALYDRLTAPGTAPILLFYGQSGVGKSSILDAGLIPRLERDYEVRYLRRTPVGLLATLRSALSPEGLGEPLETAWRKQEEQAGKPLIVFLDQVEESFTRPIPELADELGQLAKALKATFSDPSRRPQGKLVLGFRKEWLAELESRLAAYELPRAKVFLEPLDRAGIIEVMRGPADYKRLQEQYGLAVEDRLAEIIADKLLADRDSPIAPTLQILLTKMWGKAKQEDDARPHFSQASYQELVDKGILLGDFLDQQIAAFGEVYPEQAASGLLVDLLARHTTTLGTADQCGLDELERTYAHLGPALPGLLQSCQDLYLLTVTTGPQKESTQTTRLLHDTLAPLVRDRFERSDQPGQRARRILESRAVDWRDDAEGTPLDEADLALVEEGHNGMRAPTTDEQRLVEASRRRRASARYRRRISRAIGTVVVLAVLAASGVAWFQRKETDRATAEAQANIALKHWGAGVGSRDLSRPTEAAHRFARAAASPDPLLADAARLAAADSVGVARLVHVLSPDGTLVGASFNSDATRVLGWSGYFVSFSDFGGFVQLWDLQTDRQVLAPLRHESPLVGARFDPSEKRILTWTEAGIVRLWDAATGEEVFSPLSHGDKVRNALFNADGTRILSWGDDNTVRLYDAETGQAVVPPLHHDRAVVGATLSTDETQVLSWSEDGTVRLWDATTGRAAIRALRHRAQVRGAVFDVDSTRILSWGADGVVRLWAVDTGRQIATMRHQSSVVGAAFDANHTRVFSWSLDGTVRIWDLSTGGKALGLLRHAGAVYGATFSSDETRVLTWSDDNTVRLWDTSSAEVIATLQHADLVDGAAFDRDERFVLSWSDDGSVWLWDATSPKRLLARLRHESQWAGAIFNADGSKVLSWCSSENHGCSIRLWDVDAEKGHGRALEHEGSVYGAMFNASGTVVLTWSEDGTLRLWNASTGKLVGTPLRHRGPVRGGSFNRAETRILSWSGSSYEEAAVYLWDAQTREKIVGPLPHADGVRGVTLNQKETLILTWSGGGALRLWDARTGAPVGHPLLHEDAVEGASLSADETRILSFTAKGVTLWNVETGDKEPVLRHHENDRILGAAFYADDSRILSWSGNPWGGTRGEIRLWDAATGQELVAPIQHGGRVGGAVLSADESLILSWSRSFMGVGSVWVWDATTGDRVIGPLRHDDTVQGAGFNADESRILSWSEDQTVRLWSLATGEAVIPPLPHAGHVLGAVFNTDETRILSWSGGWESGAEGAVYLWDMGTGHQAVLPFRHERSVGGAAWNSDETQILSRSGTTVRLLDASYDKEVASDVLAKQIEVRTGTRLTRNSETKILTRQEWMQAKSKNTD